MRAGPGRALVGLALAGLLLSGCATPTDELRDEVVRTRAAAESAAESKNPDLLRSQVATLVALIARQRTAGDLSPEQATALTQLAQKLADDAKLLGAPAPAAAPTPTPTPAPTTASPTPTPSPTPEPVEVPDLAGLSEEQAAPVLLERGLAGVGAGCDRDGAAIVAQQPPAGTRVPPGSTVSYACEVAATPEPEEDEEVKVPDVTGQSFADAQLILAEAMLNAVDDGSCVDPALPVLAQSPDKGEKVPAGTEVLLTCA